MKKAYFALIYSLIFITSCKEHRQTQLPKSDGSESKTILSKQPKIKKNYKLSDTIRCAFLDKKGILWFGTNNEGIYRYDGKSFTNFSERDGLCNNQVTSIIADRNGSLLLGTADGLCRYDGKSFTPIAIPWDGNKNLWGEGMNAKLVLCLMQDQKDNIWFGTWGAGAYRYDGKNFTSFLADKGRLQSDSLHRNVIQSIMEDEAGNIWFTSMTHGGVSRYDGTSFTHFMPKDGLSDDMVWTSFQDSAGNIWFGSLGNRKGSLDRYDGKSFTNFNEADGLCNNNVINICEDRTGKLWLASNRGKLCIYDGKTFTAFSTKEGQNFYGISFIIEDATGNIWFGGQYGRLFRYDGNTLTDFTQKG